MEIYHLDRSLASICGGIMDTNENCGYPISIEPLNNQYFFVVTSSRYIKIYHVDDFGKIIYLHDRSWFNFPCVAGMLYTSCAGRIYFYDWLTQKESFSIPCKEKAKDIIATTKWMVITTKTINKIVNIQSLKEYDTTLKIVHISYDGEILCHIAGQNIKFIDFKHYIATCEEHCFFTVPFELEPGNFQFYGNKRFRLAKNRQPPKSYKYDKNGFKLCKRGMACMIPFSQKFIDERRHVLKLFPNPVVDIIVNYIIGINF